MGKGAKSVVPQAEVRPAMLVHSAEAELDALGAEVQCRADDHEAQRTAERVAADLREMVEDLIVRGDAEGLAVILGSVRGLASAEAAVALARERATAL
jgi:hypothetical protein